MHTTHSDRPINPNPRSLGDELRNAVRSEHGDVEGVLERISRLPRSHAAQLSDVAVELCGIRQGRANAEEVYRSHVAGARLTIQCGLAFDANLVNGELLPALMRVPSSSSGLGAKDIWGVRLVRTLGLGQLAPRVDDTAVDGVLKAVLAHSEMKGSLRSHLHLAFADFEESFRVGAYLYDGALRAEVKNLCLRAIADLFELSVEGLAESSPENFTEALNGLLPWTKIAAVSLLTMAPSIGTDYSQAVSMQTDRIVDAMEWLLKRPFRFPGDYFLKEERDLFDSARSLVGLAYGVLSANSPAWRERFEELTLPEPQGAHLLGTAFLGSMKRVGVEAAVEWGRDIARTHILEAAQPNNLVNQLQIEAIALSWHLGAAGSSDFERVMEFASNPTAQLLCAKALRDLDPWEQG